MIELQTQAGMAVELRDVVRVYGGRQARVRALDGVGIGFVRGTWTAVMGPSGSGKSTLLHCAAGLERPTSGQVLLGDRDLAVASERELTRLRRQDVGFVFQSFNLLGSLTAEQNVALPLRLAGRKVSMTDVRQILTDV
ncbi:ATP-binding cassette domain-containing protein, partial [Micromonospora sp. NPDC023814]|uniref:ABC transporter ATP-binding protein n=1 Tax=Micromonospora sp. NPDC023814 TaxID=3154596 RepID=UPI0033F10905